MLTGEPPFRGKNARITMAKHVTEPARSVRALRPEVPVAIDTAIATALSKDPARRFSSVAAFASAVCDEAAPEGVRARGYPTATRTVAVLPFVNGSSDPENEYLSDGITEELIDALAKVPGLRVASRTSVFALKGKLQDVRAIGALLGAPVVLEGSIRRSGQQLRVTAQLTSTDDGRLLWSQRYDRTLQDVFAVQDEIARTIVNTLRATWFSDLAIPEPRRYTENVKAYGLYLRGRHAWNKRTQEGVAEGIRYFEQAIAEDPSYALAYTGLADAYALHVDYRSVPVHEGFAHAKAYARQAIALDERLAEAHASLAWSLFIYDWDWAGASREFLRAIELDPRYASGHTWYAFLLASQGRLEEALVEAHTGLELDPAAVSARRSTAWVYYYARRYDQSEYHLTRAIEMNPLAEETFRVLGLVLSMRGQHDEAERVLREAVAMPEAGSYTTATLGYVLARGGRRAEAERILHSVEDASRRGYVSPVALATLHIGLGDHERALDEAERALEERRGWLAYLRVNPLMDSLRGEPRFDALIRRMGL
jgi:TolB-like protein/tetratricopeptide (TPR) repeat protein